MLPAMCEKECNHQNKTLDRQCWGAYETLGLSLESPRSVTVESSKRWNNKVHCVLFDKEGVYGTCAANKIHKRLVLLTEGTERSSKNQKCIYYFKPDTEENKS